MKTQLLTYLTAGTLLLGTATASQAVNDSTVNIYQAKRAIAQGIHNDEPRIRKLESVINNISSNIHYQGNNRFKVKYERNSNRFYGFEDRNRDGKQQPNEQTYFKAFLKENAFLFHDYTKPSNHRRFATMIPYDIQMPVRHKDKPKKRTSKNHRRDNDRSDDRYNEIYNDGNNKIIIIIKPKKNQRDDDRYGVKNKHKNNSRYNGKFRHWNKSPRTRNNKDCFDSGRRVWVPCR